MLPTPPTRSRLMFGIPQLFSPAESPVVSVAEIDSTVSRPHVNLPPPSDTVVGHSATVAELPSTVSGVAAKIAETPATVADVSASFAEGPSTVDGIFVIVAEGGFQGFRWMCKRYTSSYHRCLQLCRGRRTSASYVPFGVSSRLMSDCLVCPPGGRTENSPAVHCRV